MGEVLRGWRMHKEIGLRALAKEIGVSASTLSRMENGETCSGEVLSKVLVWLMSESASK